MSDVVIYLFEASALLIVLYGIYLLLLSKETFFTFNRYYLMGIFALSLLIPLLNGELVLAELSLFIQPVEELGDMRVSYHRALTGWSTEAESANMNTDQKFWQVGDLILAVFVSIYVLGLIINVSRMFWTLYRISNLKSSFPKIAIDNVRVVKVSHEIAPFSFMKDVFIHTDNLMDEEFTQILAHEKAHIEQKHSIDLLIVQSLAAILWFNPVAWKLIKSLKTTHEYIADKKIINAGYSLVEYQSLLLRQLISNNSFGLVHNFNLSFIKKRITMMKIKESGWTGKVKVAMAVASAIIIGGVIVQCNSKIDDQISVVPESLVADFSDEVNLPVLPETGFKYTGDLSDALNFTIIGDKLSINGEYYGLEGVIPVIENSGLTEKGIIVMKVDKKQDMKVVSDVHMKLRKAR